MSVTYMALNLDKHEFIDPHAFGEGGKDYECMTNTFSAALVYLLLPGGETPPDQLLRGRWHGDRITLVNDYCEKHDYEESMAGHGPAKDISYEVMREVDASLDDMYPDRKQEYEVCRVQAERRHRAALPRQKKGM